MQGDIDWTEKHHRLSDRAEKRTELEIREFKRSGIIRSAETDGGFFILHLSDIHLSTPGEAKKYRMQLGTDLFNELKIDRLHYLVISGDIAYRSTPEEYKAAFDLTDGIVKRFGLDIGRIAVVPGNHDLNWDMSAENYTYVPRHNRIWRE